MLMVGLNVSICLNNAVITRHLLLEIICVRQKCKETMLGLRKMSYGGHVTFKMMNNNNDEWKKKKSWADHK